MKKHLKSVWILLITALCVAICIVAFLGITKLYGDVETIRELDFLTANLYSLHRFQLLYL